MLLSKPPEGSNFWHQTEGFKNVYDLERIKILELFLFVMAENNA